MKRLFFLLLLAVWCAPAKANEPLLLKQNANVTGESITFNDLLETSVPQGSFALFAAPAPGESGIIQTSRVIEAAQSYGLPEIALPAWSEIAVKRQARIISADEIKEALLGAFTKKLRTSRDKIEISFGRPQDDVRIESTAQASLQITRLKREALSDRFEASLVVADSKLSAAAPLIVTGTIVEMVDAVHLKRDLSRGEAISEDDITLEPVKKQFAANALRKISDVVGLSARYALSESNILRDGDVERPKIVARNDIVLIVYETPSLSVTARGKATTAGAQGDVIEVQNLQSKRNVLATIAGPGKVTISAMPTRRIADLSSGQSPTESPQ